MTGRPDATRLAVDDERTIDDRVIDELDTDPTGDTGGSRLPEPLDAPIEMPLEDAIESRQSVGDLDDEFEPHA